MLALAGELDLLAAVPVAEELLRLEAAGPDPITLDLSGLTFVDSSGVELLLEAGRRAAATGRDLRVRRGPQPVHRVFELTRTDAALPFVEPAG